MHIASTRLGKSRFLWTSLCQGFRPPNSTDCHGPVAADKSMCLDQRWPISTCNHRGNGTSHRLWQKHMLMMPWPLVHQFKNKASFGIRGFWPRSVHRPKGALKTIAVRSAPPTLKPSESLPVPPEHTVTSHGLQVEAGPGLGRSLGRTVI